MRMDVRFWVDFQADLAPRCLSRPPDQVEVDLVVRHKLWKINSLIDILWTQCWPKAPWFESRQETWSTATLKVPESKVARSTLHLEVTSNKTMRSTAFLSQLIAHLDDLCIYHWLFVLIIPTERWVQQCTIPLLCQLIFKNFITSTPVVLQAL